MTIPNTKRRRKISPLQRWKVEYAYVVRQITALKPVVQDPFKEPDRSKRFRNQSRLMFLRDKARELMAERIDARDASRLLWEMHKPGKVD